MLKISIQYQPLVTLLVEKQTLKAKTGGEYAVWKFVRDRDDETQEKFIIQQRQNDLADTNK